MSDRPILQACIFGGSGGVEHHVLALSKGLAARSDCVVVTVEDGWLASAASDVGLRVITVPDPRGNFDLATYRALRSVLRANQERIVHSHLGRSDWYVWVAAIGMPSLRMVTTEHGISAERPDLFVRGAQRSLHEYAHNRRLRRTDAVVAVSQSTASALVARYPALRHKPPVVIAPGIDARALGRIPPHTREPGAPLSVLTVARLSAEKGVDIALRGLSRLREMGVAARLTIVGDGPELQALQRLALELRVQDDVSFVGRVEEVAPYLAQADVFVLTSRSENLPIALLEAMAAGLPVVATDVGGVAEALGAGQAGILVTSEDVDGVAAALRLLEQQPSKRTAMGTSARRLSGAYDMSNTVAALEQVYESLG